MQQPPLPVASIYQYSASNNHISLFGRLSAGILSLALWTPAISNAGIIAFAILFEFASRAYIALAAPLMVHICPLKILDTERVFSSWSHPPAAWQPVPLAAQLSIMREVHIQACKSLTVLPFCWVVVSFWRLDFLRPARYCGPDFDCFKNLLRSSDYKSIRIHYWRAFLWLDRAVWVRE